MTRAAQTSSMPRAATFSAALMILRRRGVLGMLRFWALVMALLEQVDFFVRFLHLVLFACYVLEHIGRGREFTALGTVVGGGVAVHLYFVPEAGDFLHI